MLGANIEAPGAQIGEKVNLRITLDMEGLIGPEWVVGTGGSQKHLY
jgi:hypothetical protein